MVNELTEHDRWTGDVLCAANRVWMWVLCWMVGLAMGSPGQYIFRNWQSEDGLPVNLVWSVVQAADGHIWAATPEGIVRFDGLEFERMALPMEFSASPAGPARLFATEDGAVWLADARGRLLWMLGARSTLFWPEGGEGDSVPVTQVLDGVDGGVAVLRGGECWRVAGGEARRLSPVPPELARRFVEDAALRGRTGRLGKDGVPGRLTDRVGSEWSALPRGGLVVTSPEGVQRPLVMPRVGADLQVNEMLLDREGNIWVATALSGLGVFREERVDALNAAAGLSEGAVLGVLEDSRRQVWVGNRRGGIERLRDGGIEHFDLLAGGSEFSVSAIHEDRDGRLWVATSGGPVFVWREGQFVEAFTQGGGPVSANAIHHDGDGTLWFGGPNGLDRSVSRRITKVGVGAGFPGGEVTVLSGGPDGELWVGTAQGFVLRNVGGRLETIATPGDLAYGRVTGILVSAHNQAWISTMAGLFLLDGGRRVRFERAQGLPDNRLTSVIDDQLGHMWFGSVGGILRASREDLMAHARDPEVPIHWLRMDRSDGLPTRECVVGHQPAAWRFANGSIWFPTNLGMVRLDPSRTMINRNPPPVVLRSVRAGGIDQVVGEGVLQVGPGRTRLEFRYHGLNFSAPEKVTYRTRLVGFNDSWRDEGVQRVTTYDEVPPGEYRFEVVAINGDGFQSGAPAAVRIAIRPRFWETRWFVVQMGLVVVLTAGGIGWIIARARLNRRITQLRIQQAREAERARIARDLHDDLGASLTEFSLLTDLGAEQAAGSPFQEQIERLSDKSRALGQALDEIVWAVNPREDSLESLINYLATFAGEFLDRARITLRLDIPTGLPQVPLDATVRHAVFLAVRETFNNVVKHAQARTAWLKVSCRDDLLEVVVEDDGVGMSADAMSHGDGIGNFESRMAACNGRVSISPRAGGGTVVRFLIPLLALPGAEV